MTVCVCVCDVRCRQTIWIEPEDRDESGGLRRVALCLEAIAKDSSVEVVAVKNAMHQVHRALLNAPVRLGHSVSFCPLSWKSAAGKLRTLT